MKETSSNQKTSQSMVDNPDKHGAAGPDGASFMPPIYGIEHLDLTVTPQPIPLQMKADPSAGSDGAESTTRNRTGLPNGLKSGIESLSGFSLDDVRVHYNSSKPAQLQALAYAQGTNIHIAPGQERHLPHEAWHVVQQKQGRVKATMQMKGGVPGNNDKGLEHEADTMGTRALGGGTHFSVGSTDRQPWNPGSVIQRQAIKSAGLELELKGASVSKGYENKTEYGPHEKVIDGGNWWIEVDSYNPELVTKPTESREKLLEWLALGHAVLKDIQLYAEKATALNLLDNEHAPGARELMDEMSEILKRLPLPMDASVELSTQDKYLAKPQISFGIKKGELGNFASSIMKGKIKFTEGYTKTGEKHENTEWPRVNADVQKIWSSSPIWQNEKGKDFLKQLSTASTEAKGLSMMTIITILFATRKQDPTDIWQYYKARFSVMPRVPLSELYDTLKENQQEEYTKLMVLWHEAIKLNNKDKDESNEGYHPTKIYRAQKDEYATIADELKSIIASDKRHKKTLKDKDKQVDAISSDALASTINVGASVGALDLPEESDGIYEIRSIPYIKINDYKKVEKIYTETIDAYGGMA